MEMIIFSFLEKVLDQFHEEDLENIVLVGRRWFGEQFNIENEQTFDFTFPNIVSSQTAALRVQLQMLR